MDLEEMRFYFYRLYREGVGEIEIEMEIGGKGEVGGSGCDRRLEVEAKAMTATEADIGCSCIFKYF